MDTTVIMDTTTRTPIGKPNREDLDPPRVDTARDNAVVAESLCALATALVHARSGERVADGVAESLCALATALEQDRGVAPTGLGRATPDGKPEDRSGVNSG